MYPYPLLREQSTGVRSSTNTFRIEQVKGGDVVQIGNPEYPLQNSRPGNGAVVNLNIINVKKHIGFFDFE